MLYTSSWLRFEFTTPVVMGTDFIGSCKSNNHDGPSSLFEWIQDPYIILAETCHTKRRYLSKCTRDVSGSQFFFCAAIIHNVKWTKYFFVANYINFFMDKRLIVYGVVTGDRKSTSNHTFPQHENHTHSNIRSTKTIHIHIPVFENYALFYYCLLLRELFSYSVARALYLTRQHYRKTVLEGEDNNIFST